MLSAEDKFQYWLDYAQNDFDTAQVMFDTGRWFYVYITCQQAIEKLVKGLYILYIDDNVPRVHLIASVFNKFADKLPEPLDDKYRELFETLTNFYLRSRYPDYARKLAQSATKENAEAILSKTKEVWKWLLTMKPPKN